MVQLLQSALFVQKESALLQEEMLRAKEGKEAALATVDRAKGDLRKLRKENEGLKAVSGEVKGELAQARKELAQLTEEKCQLEAECTRLKKVCADGAVYFAMETKVKLLEEYVEGTLGQYNLDEEREVLAEFRNANPGIGEFSESDSAVGVGEAGSDADSRLAEGDDVVAESDVPVADPVGKPADGDVPAGETMVTEKSVEL